MASEPAGAKTDAGRYFEDFVVGATLVHATPRTVTAGDAALYGALYGARFAPTSALPFARALGLPGLPVDGLLAFHLVFGKSVPDVSLNAVANLGYASGRFGVPVHPGDTITATSRVLGAKPNRDGATGVVWVHTVGTTQRGEAVVDYVRWVMVRRRDAGAAPSPAVVPELPEAVRADELVVPYRLAPGAWDAALAGSPHAWEDYAPGERIDHVDGTTIEEAEHMLAARLYQNTARVHFNHHVERTGRFGRRIVYGGHVLSIARALSFNGLANAFAVVAINGGRHVAPAFAGDTIHAWSEILDRAELPARDDLGALRVRTVATKDRACADFPHRAPDGTYDPAVVLDFDYWVVVPRSVSMRR